MRILRFLLVAVVVVWLALPVSSAAAENTVGKVAPTAAPSSSAPNSVKAPSITASAVSSNAQEPTPKTLDNLETLVLDIIRRNPKIVLESVTEYQAVLNHDRQLEAIKKNLEKPTPVDLSKAVVLGKANSTYTLVEFADFQCPYCIKVHPTIQALLSKYKNQMRFAFLNLPLPSHEQAQPAAQAVWAAGKQGKFFEFHDRLFDLQGKIEPGDYETIAKDLNLNLERFNSDRNSEAAKAAVEADVKQAMEIGITGTPSFVFNGVLLQGALPLEDFEGVIDLLKEAKA